MGKKKQEPIYLGIYKNKDGKETFEQFRFEPKEEKDPTDETKTIKSMEALPNEFIRFKAMNRSARMNVARAKRRSKTLKVEEEAKLTELPSETPSANTSVATP